MPLEQEPGQLERKGEQPKTGGSEQSPFLNVLLPVLTVVGTGIGVIGFVIFFGGFIVWTRFDAAGLPANEAVAKVPRNELVATGASFLVPALLAALAAVAVAVVLWDAVIGNRRRTRDAQRKAARIRAAAALEKLRAEADRIEIEMKGCLAEAAEQRQKVDAAEAGSDARESARRAQDAAETKHRQLMERLARLREHEIPEARNAQADAIDVESEAERPGRKERFLRIAIGGIPMLVAEILIIGVGWDGLSNQYRALLVAVALMTLALAIVVISATGHFGWYTLSVFLGVGVMIAFSAYARTQTHAKVSPLAAINAAGPIAGFLVAETDDAVYVGLQTPDADARRERQELQFEDEAMMLLRFSKSTLTNLTIGPLMDERDAYRRSALIALAMCEQSTEPTPREVTASSAEQPGGALPPPPCTARQVKRLRTQLSWTEPTAVPADRRQADARSPG
ncbi:MAG TPA: hypothetical protein VFU04_04720 [Solirubrobacterales bacterium]|nr:hypothetical protein [Solirubrobacterales bacterium]